MNTAQGAGPWISSGAAQDLDRAMALPLNNTPNTGEVFALSASEVNRYLPADTGPGCNTRQAQNHGTSTNVVWWLRSLVNGQNNNTVRPHQCRSHMLENGNNGCYMNRKGYRNEK